MGTRTLWWGLLGLGALLVVWIVGSKAVVAGIEEAKYTVIETRAAYEIRRYEAALLATTAMPSSSSADRGNAFRAIAGYIFGGNEAKQSIAMTAPVVMAAPSEKIAMTAPVVMGRDANGAGTMAFVMPSKYKTIDELPKPKDARVILREQPAHTVAALRFSGYATDETVAAKSAELADKVKADGWKALSAPYLASYDPPFSIPMLKRHDILIDIEKKP
jgi:SOUL heme-binding protein